MLIVSNNWENINKLRETSIEISHGYYSATFAKNSKILEKGKSYFYDKSEKVKSVFAPELIRVRLNENYEVEYQNLEIGYYYEKQKEKFETSSGVFISLNRGEFGGELITPKETLYGNFVEIFECDGIIYGIDALNHMCCAHTNIYFFDKNLNTNIVYSSQNFDLKSWGGLSEVSFKSVYIKANIVYALVSESRKINNTYIEKSYLFEIEKGKIINTYEFDSYFWSVTNMIINDGKMILGMDKVVTIVDLTTKGIKVYTPISIEAEKDILETNEYD